MSMSSTIWPAVKAFLLGPVIGTAVCWLLFIFFDVPRGTAHAPLYTLFLIGPFVLLFLYGATWIVGIPLYLLLMLLKRPRPQYFLYVFALCGVFAGMRTQWGHWDKPLAGTMLLVCVLTGAATGAAFARLLSPPDDARVEAEPA